MYKLMIVDDEMLSRVGMESLIDWNRYGYEVIGTADSAERALEMIAKEKPDVIFTDVVMQDMSGVELTRVVKQRYPEILVVALSCYSDIAYVKNIIRYGAEDYLQKLSMTPEDIVGLLEQLTTKLDKQRGVLSVERDDPGQLFLRVLNESDKDAVQRLHMAIAETGEPSYRVAVIRVRDAETATQRQGSVVRQAIDWLCDEYLQPVYGIAYVREGQTAALIRSAPQEDMRGRAQRIVRHAKTYINLDVVIGMSQSFTNLSEIPIRYKKADVASHASYLAPAERVFFFSPENQREANALSSRGNRVRELIGCLDLEGALEAATRLVACMKQVPSQSVVSRQIFTMILTEMVRKAVESDVRLDNMGVMEDIAHASLDEIEDIDQAFELFSGLLRRVAEQIVGNNSRHRDDIRKLLSYIEAHYAENITLSRAAAIVCMSESHLSGVFKKETGKGLIRYLEEYRIAVAAKMMMETKEPFYLIAEKVGYPNVNYFGRVFKKVRGETPSQFVERQKCEEKTE